MNLEAVFTSQRTLEAARVSTKVFEAGAGTPMLFLHGNPDTHTVWHEQVRALAPRFRCIAPDLPGFGVSLAPSDFDCSIENQGAWVAAVADGLGLSKFHLVMHDVGTIYGSAFAASHPDRLLSVTWFNGGFFPEQPWHFWAKVWRTPVVGELSMLLGNRSMFVAEMTKKATVPEQYANHAYDAFGPRARKMVLRWYRAMDLSKVLQGWDEKLLRATSGLPRQVIWGDRDVYVPAAIAERFRAPVHHLDCGHWAMVERPAESTALIDAIAAGAVRSVG